MSSSSQYGVPNDTKTTGIPPAYLENIPMTSPRRSHPDVYNDAMPYRPREEATYRPREDAMPYRPRERSTEKVFRQLCCGSCWGFCAWVVGIVIILAGVIIVAVVLASKSKNPAANDTSPTQLTSTITITTASQQPSMSISTTTVSPTQPSIITDTTTAQGTTSTMSFTSTAIVTVSPPQISTVTTSISRTATTLTTTSVSTKTSLLQIINQQREPSPSCFMTYIDGVYPGLYTGQSWSDIISSFSSTDENGSQVLETGRASQTGVGIGGTKLVWHPCGNPPPTSTTSTYHSDSSTFSATPVPSPPSISSLATILSLATTLSLPTTTTTTTTGPTSKRTLLAAPTHPNLAVLRRQIHATVTNGSGAHSWPADSMPASSTAVPVTYIQSLNIGTIKRTQTVIYTPGVQPYTSTPSWRLKTRTDALTARDASSSIFSAQGNHPTASPVTLVETLPLGSTIRKETLTFSPGVQPYTSTPDWQRKTKTYALVPRLVPKRPITLTETLIVGSITREETVPYTPGVHPYTSTPDSHRKTQTDALTARQVPSTAVTIVETPPLGSTTRKETFTYAPGNSPYTSTPKWQRPTKSTSGGQSESAIPVTMIETLALESTTRRQTVTFTPGVHPYTSTTTWQPHTHTHKRDALTQQSSAPSSPGSPFSVVICALEPNKCTTLLTTTSKLTSFDIGPPITASSSASQNGNRSTTVRGTESLPAQFSQIRTSSTQTLPTTGTVSLDSIENPPPAATQDGGGYRRKARQMPDRSLASSHQHMNTFLKRSLNPRIVVRIVLACLIVLIAAAGVANRRLRHGKF